MSSNLDMDVDVDGRGYVADVGIDPKAGVHARGDGPSAHGDAFRCGRGGGGGGWRSKLPK